MPKNKKKEEISTNVPMHIKIYRDGDMWCIFHGLDLQNGTVGFGSSLLEAIIDFDKIWRDK